MELFQKFNDPNSKVKSPKTSLCYAITLCMSSVYFGYMLVYLSAIDFPVIANIYSITYDLSFAQGLSQGVLPIGAAVGAMLSTLIISRLSRRYFNNNKGKSYSGSTA